MVRTYCQQNNDVEKVVKQPALTAANIAVGLTTASTIALCAAFLPSIMGQSSVTSQLRGTDRNGQVAVVVEKTTQHPVSQWTVTRVPVADHTITGSIIPYVSMPEAVEREPAVPVPEKTVMRGSSQPTPPSHSVIVESREVAEIDYRTEPVTHVLEPEDEGYDDGRTIKLETYAGTEEVTHPDVHQTSFARDFRSSLKYAARNSLSALLFRGSTDAVKERNVTYVLPETGPLRNSMMHSARLYDGLRGGSANVGDTVASALRGSYVAKARLERANADRARVHEALAAYLPRINGRITASRNSPSSTRTTVSNGGDFVEANVSLNMPLFTSGVNYNRYRQAKHAARASAYSFLAEEQRVALEAVTAHVNLRLNRRVEMLLERNVSSLNKIVSIANKLFKAGDASRTDIAVAQANVESARSEVELSRRAREETQADFESITGVHAPSNLGKVKYKQLIPDSRNTAVGLALNSNPLVAASRETALASKHAARAERGRFGPQVNLFADYDKELYKSNGDLNDDDWTIGVRLEVPLFDATLSAATNAARHQALESGYQALDQARLIERQVEREWAAYQAARRRASILAKQVKQIGKTVTGAKREFEAGFRSVTDVLNEQIRLVRAEISLERARHEKMLSAYTLGVTTGNPAIAQISGVRLATLGK